MSTHIGSEKGAIAPTVLLPGDPLRAEWIAKTFLSSTIRYNAVRNMYGYTGWTQDGKLVSVQGSGMGMPSLGIYVHELIHEFGGVERIIRVGSAGGLQPEMHARDIIIAQGASSNAGTNTRRFRGMQFAPLADPTLFIKAIRTAEQLKLSVPVRVGGVVSTEIFYNDVDPDEWKLWAGYGVLAVDMETSELYTLGAKKEKGFQALSLLTISDVLPTGEQLTADARERSLGDMVRIALAIS
jgi:purine-nucleoside phosphorylase